jgi:hypothetical protein
MNKAWIFLVLAALLSVRAQAADEFSGVTCGFNVSKALIGKRTSTTRAAVIEGRHTDLGLKDLGGFEVSDRLFLVSWLICGTEFEVLENVKKKLIVDVLGFPSHSASSPQFMGACQVDSKELPETVIAILDNSAGYSARNAKSFLKATAAWKIDELRERFEAISRDNLKCPLSGVVTEDGGP